MNVLNRKIAKVALLAEGVDRNSVGLTSMVERNRSPSSRRAWIEIDLRADNTLS